jgi:hypothetical protein
MLANSTKKNSRLQKESMKKKVYLVKNQLVEYNGDMYTPEELAKKLELKGNVEVILHDADDTWFGRALQTLEPKQ